MSPPAPIEWRPCDLLSARRDPDAPNVRPYAVLILNQAVNRNALDAVIQQASLLVCADGGADRLRTYENDIKKRGQEEGGGGGGGGGEGERKEISRRLPDVIVGDLDSVTPETLDYYRARNVQIVRQPDQYSTDFAKGLRWIREEAVARRGNVSSRCRHRDEDLVDSQDSDDDNDNDNLDVVVLGGLGGRVDQGLSQIHHLYVASRDKQLLKGRIYLLSEQSLSFILDAGGLNVIHIEPGYFEQNVGIIPMRGQATISLKGFEWDVQDWPTEFGSQISTSNHIRSDQLQVSFKGEPLLFTLELAERLQASHV